MALVAELDLIRRLERWGDRLATEETLRHEFAERAKSLFLASADAIRAAAQAST